MDEREITQVIETGNTVTFVAEDEHGPHVGSSTWERDEDKADAYKEAAEQALHYLN